MADDTTVDQQQLQATLNEAWQKVRDIIRAQLGTIQIGENQALGVLSTIDTLAEAPVGDQAALLQAIGLGMLTDAINGEASDVRSALGLGVLSTIDTLAEAPVGDQAALLQAIGLGALVDAINGEASDVRSALGLGSAATYADSRYAKLSGGDDANFTAMPLVGGSPIVESGSNNDGSWIRYADGTQIARHRDKEGDYGGGPVQVTFPVPFSESSPIVIPVAQNAKGYVSTADVVNETGFTGIALKDADGGDYAGTWFMYIAMGDWK